MGIVIRFGGSKGQIEGEGLNEWPQTQQVPNMHAVVHDWLHSEDLLSLP